MLTDWSAVDRFGHLVRAIFWTRVISTLASSYDEHFCFIVFLVQLLLYYNLSRYFDFDLITAEIGQRKVCIRPHGMTLYAYQSVAVDQQHKPEEILPIQTTHYEPHCIHKFLHRMPSGHLRGYRHRCSGGRNCVLWRLVLFITDTIYLR